MEVLNLFPTNVYVEENSDIDNKKLSKIILEKEKTESSMTGKSNQGGWHSSDDLFNDERFSKIIEYSTAYVRQICQHNNYKEDFKIMLDNMWAIVNRHKDYNITHIHENVDWSFVYYVKVPKNSGNLIFLDPRIRRIKDRSTSFIKNYDNPFTHSIYFFSPLEGKFVIFPSYLEHYVEFNTTNKPRICISGNIKIEETLTDD